VKLKADLHIHTADDPVDRISYTTFELIDRAAELGYGALAITLHDRQLDLMPYDAYAVTRGIVLIPGIERTVHGRHILLLNFSRRAEAVKSYSDIARLKRTEPDGLVIAPHPFFPSRKALRHHLERCAILFDAVEYNAMFTPLVNFNTAAERFARRHDLPIVGNGDVHRLEMLGTTYSLIDAAPDPTSICNAVKAGDLTVVSNPHTLPRAAAIMTKLFTSAVMPNTTPHTTGTSETIGTDTTRTDRTPRTNRTFDIDWVG
jgi:predicted metal-dependent phosphoesterase TrpH